MPLSFSSTTHGNIAFGFFNIESDMLLLDRYFFFADQFCSWMCELADPETPARPARVEGSVFYIPDSHDIGDLMGAIHGVRFTGFIGEIYRRFPFPEDPLAFKQNPRGDQTRKPVVARIEKFARKEQMPIELCPDGQVRIGEYGFDPGVFHLLIQYVWQGGYPRWKEGIRPPCVLEMKTFLQASSHPLFQGVF